MLSSKGDFAVTFDLLSFYFNCLFSKMLYFSSLCVVLHFVTPHLTLQQSVILKYLKFSNSRFFLLCLYSRPLCVVWGFSASFLLFPFLLLSVLLRMVTCPFFCGAACSSLNGRAKSLVPLCIYNISCLSRLWHFSDWIILFSNNCKLLGFWKYFNYHYIISEFNTKWELNKYLWNNRFILKPFLYFVAIQV